MRKSLFRDALFQIHLWTGLILGVLFILLGLSGSVLVYRAELDSPALPQASGRGEPAPLSALVSAAEGARPGMRATAISLPQRAGEPATIRLSARRAGGESGDRRRGFGGPQIYVDPITTAVLGTGKAGMSPLVRFAHDMHGHLFIRQGGRQLVGGLGVLMLVLGATGLVLWWPRAAVWKRAFYVRRKARGYSLHRELHGATGIWSLVVFLVVSFTGVAIVFPQTVRSGVTLITGEPAATRPAFNMRRGPVVTPVPGGHAIGPDKAVALVRERDPADTISTIMLPAGPRDAYRILMHPEGGGPLQVAFVDPWRAELIASPSMTAADRFVAWQRPLHEGEGLGPVWRVLVFLSGFLPLLFTVTGVTMWWKKRRGRAAMAKATREEANA